MKYASNQTNFANSDLVVSSFLPTQQDAIAPPNNRSGSGLVGLSGNYTGAESAAIEVEIIDNIIDGVPQISAPQYSGAGNGPISDISATSGSVAQKIDVELVDLGTRTRKAWMPIEGVFLRSKIAGPAGNSLTLIVDHSGITRTATALSLLDQINEGENAFIGSQWDFGGLLLQEDGTLAEGSPRISFGEDTTIYRQYKYYSGGRYIFAFAPAPDKTYAEGTRVNTVSGTRSATIGGVTYNSLISVYSFLDAVRNNPLSVVEIDGVVVRDNLPTGIGVREFDLQTGAFVKTIVAEGTRYALRASIGLTTQPTSPTEKLRIVCEQVNEVGMEQWQVTGTVSNFLTRAISGVLYSESGYTFTIPRQLPDIGIAPSGDFTAEPTWRPRAEGVADPCFFLYRPTLGARATNKTYIFEYEARRTAGGDGSGTDCLCESQPVINPDPHADCLGVPIPGGGVMPTSAALIDLKSKLANDVASWHQTMSAIQRTANTNVGTSLEAIYADDGIKIIREVSTRANTALSRCFTSEYASPPRWAASTLYEMNSMRQPSADNGFLYQAKNNATSGATEPTWPIEIGELVTDGAQQWECISRSLQSEFTIAFEALKDQMTNVGIGKGLFQKWVASTALTGTILPTVRNGRFYRLESVARPSNTPPNLTGATEPTWPTNGGTVIDGDYVWRDQGVYWNASAPVKKGDLLKLPEGVYQCEAKGTTGSTEPDWLKFSNRLNNADQYARKVLIQDGTVQWRLLSLLGNGWPGLLDTIPQLLVSPTTEAAAEAKRFEENKTAINTAKRAILDTYIGVINDYLAPVYAAARINPFDDASTVITNGPDACWQDYPNEKFWWVCKNSNLQPIFNNIGYHSTKKVQASDGSVSIQPTFEFFCAFQVCPEKIFPGDRITLTIGQVSNLPLAYQVGDAFLADIVRAQPARFEGGQIGTDTMIWRVSGSSLGVLPNYSQSLITPNGYLQSGIGFKIEQGAIAFKLNDKFTFALEGGHFRWRKNAATWQTLSIQNAVTITDGLSLDFSTGIAPSWVIGDVFKVGAVSQYGADSAKRPDESFCAWAAATNLTTTTAEPVTLAFLLGHSLIDAANTVHFEGSNDDFATTQFSEALPIGESICWAGNQTCAKFRFRITGAGSTRWAYIGRPIEPTVKPGALELGTVSKRIRMPTRFKKRGVGVDVQHTFLSKEEARKLIETIEYASETDLSRLALLPNDQETEELIFAQIRTEEVALTDAQSFQPRAVSARLQTVQFAFDPVLA